MSPGGRELGRVELLYGEEIVAYAVTSGDANRLVSEDIIVEGGTDLTYVVELQLHGDKHPGVPLCACHCKRGNTYMIGLAAWTIGAFSDPELQTKLVMIAYDILRANNHAIVVQEFVRRDQRAQMQRRVDDLLKD